MKAALIYSGYLRTFAECRANHAEMLQGAEIYQYHVNDLLHELHYHKHDPEHPYEANRIPETVTHATLNQWRNNMLAFQLAPKDLDVYVRMRYDITISKPIDLSSYDYADNRIYIPRGNDYRDGINDQFAFGSYKAMAVYFDMYNHHEQLFNKGYQFHTESYLYRHLLDSGIEIIRIEQENKIVR